MEKVEFYTKSQSPGRILQDKNGKETKSNK